MISRTINRLILATCLTGLVAPLMWVSAPLSAHPPLDATPVGVEFKDPKYLNKNSCPDDPKNLALNGGFFPDTHDTQYGQVVTPWEPFIFDGIPPLFRWVNNEGIFKSQSEQILSTAAFDAGIFEVVRNLQPGAYYWFRLGWAPAAKSFGGPNVESSAVGRKVGVDPFGGTDPKSPNVIWGADYFGDTKGLNRSELIMLFAARANNATIFLRAIARDGSGGENRVWLNAVCMEARPELGTATPLPVTATSAPPTATPRPTQTRAPATQVAQVPTKPPTAIPTATPTATPADTATPPAAPRFARPTVEPSTGLSIDPGSDVILGLGVVLVIGALFCFGLGFILWRQMG